MGKMGKSQVKKIVSAGDDEDNFGDEEDEEDVDKDMEATD
jgi:hypothetical protein